MLVDTVSLGLFKGEKSNFITGPFFYKLGVIGIATLPSGVGGALCKELQANIGDLLLTLDCLPEGPPKQAGLISLVNGSGFVSKGTGLTFLTGPPSLTYFTFNPEILPLNIS